MRKQILQLNASIPLIDRVTGLPNDQFRVFLLQVQQRGLLIGQGSPLGVVQAEQGVEYLDELGAPGAVKYIKQLADVGGDKTLGWIAIG